MFYSEEKYWAWYKTSQCPSSIIVSTETPVPLFILYTPTFTNILTDIPSTAQTFNTLVRVLPQSLHAHLYIEYFWFKYDLGQKYYAP